jgi:hypothetical protein
MLWACVLEFPQKWDDCLPLAEFSYNNSYQESIKMAPFEALYGRRCRTPLNWSEPGERWFFRPDLVKEAEEKVQRIRHRLKEAQARQKSYADKRHRPLVFQAKDYVYMKISPMKGVNRFGVKGKLAPRYCNTPGVTQSPTQSKHICVLLKLYAKMGSEGTQSLEAWLR